MRLFKYFRGINLSSALLFLVLTCSLPSFSQSTASKQLTSVEQTKIINLITEWKMSSDVLKKANIAKKMQSILGVQTDGLIGNETMTAIKNSGISIKIAKPSRSEIRITRLVLEASEEEMTIQRRLAVADSTKQFYNIQDQVKSGNLTEAQGEQKILEMLNTLKPKKINNNSKNNQNIENLTDISPKGDYGKCFGCVNGQNSDGSQKGTRSKEKSAKKISKNKNSEGIGTHFEKTGTFLNKSSEKNVHYKADKLSTKKGKKSKNVKEKKK